MSTDTSTHGGTDTTARVGTDSSTRGGTDSSTRTTTRLERRAVPGAGPEATGARTEDAASLITGARERIDALDDRIIGLVQERMAVSAVIQEARITSGGRRVNLSRELEVLGHYRDAVGKPGTALAMTLLELCRGRV